MIQVVGHRVLVKALDVAEVDAVYKRAMAAGIQFVDNEDAQLRKNAVDRGTIIALGDTAYKDFGGAPWCSQGDEVIFSRYVGKPVTDPYTNEKFVILNDEDIIAIIKQEKTE